MVQRAKTTSPARARQWRRIGIIGAVLFAVAAAIAIFRFRGSFRWDLFLATFREMNIWWIAAAGFLASLTYIGRALRWRVLIRPVCPHPNLNNLVAATAIGFTAVVIFGRAGELVRPYLISVKEKVPFSSQMAAWLLERIYDLLIVLLIFGFSLTQVNSEAAVVGPGIHWILRMGGYVVALICGACLVFLVAVRQFSDKMQTRFLEAVTFLPARHYRRVEEVVRAFASGMRSTKSHGFVLQLVLYTVAEWLIIIGSQACLFRAFPMTADLRPVDSVIFVSFVAFGSIIQIPGVGGGMQVASVLVLTEFYGLSLEAATGLSILIWLITYVIILPPGFALAFHEGINFKRLKEIEEEAQYET